MDGGRWTVDGGRWTVDGNILIIRFLQKYISSKKSKERTRVLPRIRTVNHQPSTVHRKKKLPFSTSWYQPSQMRYSDHILILKIRCGKPQEADAALRQIRKQSFDMICAWICRNNGRRADAQDIFQDVCINLVQNIRNNKYQHKAKLTTYNFKVAQNLWFKKLRKSGRNIPIDTFSDVFESPINIEEDLIVKERNEILHKYLGRLSQREQEILKLHCFERQKMSKIATIMGFKSEQTAKNFKCKAMKKLKKLVFVGGRSCTLRAM